MGEAAMEPIRVREWTLTEEIGQGGMGVVYRATHAFLRGSFALKVVRPELLADASICRRMLREASLLAELDHPGIVKGQAPFEEAGRLYLPMEFLDGRSLSQVLKENPGPWAPERAVALLREVATAVGYAHRHQPQVLHRDLKPSNLFVLTDGRIKVVDFGLAKAEDDLSSLTVDGQTVGTPTYLAPELFEQNKATAASDVYALGLILYRMLAGRLPFDLSSAGNSPLRLLVTISNAHARGLPKLGSIVPGVPAALDDLVSRAISADPAERPVDAFVFEQELQRVAGAAASGPSAAGGRPEAGRPPSADRPRPAAAPAPGALRTGRTAEQRSADDATRLGIELKGARTPAPPQPASRAAAAPADDPAEVSLTDALVTDALRKGRRGRFLSFLVVALVVAGGAAVAGLWVMRSADRDACALAREADTREEWERYVRAYPGGGCAAEAERRRRAHLRYAEAGLTWARVPTGSIDVLRGVGDGSRPVHVPAFSMLTSEVSTTQYAACTVAKACTPPNAAPGCSAGETREGALPATCVTWAQAQQYCAWLDARLPSEAEWMLAAGSTLVVAGAALDETTWHRGNSDAGLHVVARRAPNAAGFFDLYGNAWEWLADCWHPDQSGAPLDGSAWEAACAGDQRVIRGGSWSSDPSDPLAFGRRAVSASENSVDIGFRCAR